MTTVINSNGSRWAGQEPASIDALLERLATHPLDRTFERYGNFITHDALNLRGEPLEGIEGAVSFFGNFATYSHVFNIVTDDPAIIEPLTAAIESNKLRLDYLRQPPPYEPEKLVIKRKRFSTTQGECRLVYDGQELGQYGDDIELRPSGQWEGHPDRFWHGVARNELIRRHVAEYAEAA